MEPPVGDPGQMLPQRPQFPTSVCRFLQKLPELAAQMVKVDGQVCPHWPLEQTALPPLGALHVVPHVPQLLGLDDVSPQSATQGLGAEFVA